jgi:hypothetical protein
MAETSVEARQLAEGLLGLSLGRRQDQDERALVPQRLVQRDDGGDRGLAGLPGAVEEEARRLGAEYVPLPDVRLETNRSRELYPIFRNLIAMSPAASEALYLGPKRRRTHALTLGVS